MFLKIDGPPAEYKRVPVHVDFRSCPLKNLKFFLYNSFFIAPCQFHCYVTQKQVEKYLEDIVYYPCKTIEIDVFVDEKKKLLFFTTTQQYMTLDAT